MLIGTCIRMGTLKDGIRILGPGAHEEPRWNSDGTRSPPAHIPHELTRERTHNQDKALWERRCPPHGMEI